MMVTNCPKGKKQPGKKSSAGEISFLGEGPEPASAGNRIQNKVYKLPGTDFA